MKIILADDHKLFRGGLKLLLESQPDWQVVAEIDDLGQVVASVNELSPELLILDYHMPGGESSAVLSYCKQRFPELRIIALTGSKSGLVLKQLLDANADALLLKDTAPSELIDAIKKVAQGIRVITTEAAESIAEIDVALTNRELQILQLIYRGHSTAEIGEILHLSPKTADKHRENIMRKLDVNNAVQLIHRVQALGLLNSLDGYE